MSDGNSTESKQAAAGGKHMGSTPKVGVKTWARPICAICQGVVYFGDKKRRYEGAWVHYLCLRDLQQFMRET